MSTNHNFTMDEQTFDIIVSEVVVSTTVGHHDRIIHIIMSIKFPQKYVWFDNI